MESYKWFADDGSVKRSPCDFYFDALYAEFGSEVAERLHNPLTRNEGETSDRFFADGKWWTYVIE